jgi:hypothetical protein
VIDIVSAWKLRNWFLRQIEAVGCNCVILVRFICRCKLNVLDLHLVRSLTLSDDLIYRIFTALTYNLILHISLKFTSEFCIIHNLNLPIFQNKNILCRNSTSYLTLIYFYVIVTNKTFSYWNGVNDAARKAVEKPKTPTGIQMRLSAYCANEAQEILRGIQKELQAQLSLQRNGIISLSLRRFLFLSLFVV